MDFILRPAKKSDLPGMAQVYVAAFPESIRHFFAKQPPFLAIADLLGIPLAVEPESVFVIQADNQIAGYCFAPVSISSIARKAFGSGQIFYLLRRLFTGQYHIGIRALYLLSRDKLMNLRVKNKDPYHTEAHILSIAVHPDFQGQGLGKKLLERGLKYLEEQSVERIRLEVRPDNTPALHMYEQHGFITVGRTNDSQGDWLIMLKPGITHNPKG